MENLQSKLEAELLKMKEENILTIGKKVIPDIAKRLVILYAPPAPWVDDILAEGKIDLSHQTSLVNDKANIIFLSVLEKIKERIGAIPVWRIPEDEYLEIVEECRKEANGTA